MHSITLCFAVLVAFAHVANGEHAALRARSHDKIKPKSGAKLKDTVTFDSPQIHTFGEIKEFPFSPLSANPLAVKQSFASAAAIGSGLAYWRQIISSADESLPHVSVLISSFHTEKLLTRTIADIFIHQTFRNIEVLVFDDVSKGCYDREKLGEKMKKDYHAGDHVIKNVMKRLFIHCPSGKNKKQASLAERRNALASLARAPVLALWENNDIYDFNRLEVQLTMLASQRAAACVLNWAFVYDADTEPEQMYAAGTLQPSANTLMWVRSLTHADTDDKDAKPMVSFQSTTPESLWTFPNTSLYDTETFVAGILNLNQGPVIALTGDWLWVKQAGVEMEVLKQKGYLPYVLVEAEATPELFNGITEFHYKRELEFTGAHIDWYTTILNNAAYKQEKGREKYLLKEAQKVYNATLQVYNQQVSQARGHGGGGASALKAAAKAQQGPQSTSALANSVNLAVHHDAAGVASNAPYSVASATTTAASDAGQRSPTYLKSGDTGKATSAKPDPKQTLAPSDAKPKKAKAKSHAKDWDKLDDVGKKS